MLNRTLKYGLISGIIVTIYMALLYAGGIGVFSNWWFSIMLYPILFFCMFFYSNRVKKEFPNDEFGFKQAFITLFLVGMTATGIMLVWHIVLFNVIDKDLGNQLAENIIAQTLEMMEKWGAPSSAIDETMREMENLPDQFKPAGQVLSWLKGSILFVIIAAIGALIIRRKDIAVTEIDTSSK